MNREEVKETVNNLVVQAFNKDASDFNDDTNFTDDLGASSIQMLGIAANVEEETDVMINITEIGQIKTVGQLVDYILDNQ